MTLSFPCPKYNLHRSLSSYCQLSFPFCPVFITSKEWGPQPLFLACYVVLLGLCRLGWPWTHKVLSASASGVLGLKVRTITPCPTFSWICLAFLKHLGGCLNGSSLLITLVSLDSASWTIQPGSSPLLVSFALSSASPRGPVDRLKVKSF